MWTPGRRELYMQLRVPITRVIFEVAIHVCEYGRGVMRTHTVYTLFTLYVYALLYHTHTGLTSILKQCSP